MIAEDNISNKILFLNVFKGITSHKPLASHADVLRVSLTSAESKDKFLSHCSQISAGNHIQIMGDPIGAVEVKVLTSQTHTYKLDRV